MSTSPLPIPTQKRTLWLLLAAILALYALMLIPTLTRQGISWDEQTDIDITRAYLKPDGWLAGSDSDPSQTRLPMFTVALVYKLLGTDDLLTGRFVSVLVGGLTILGIYVYGARTFGKKQGLLAALLLASSPFFLSFARIAFTESDIYLACTLAWLMVALSRFQEKPTLGRAAVSGILLGLCISAKFTALTLLPAVWMAVYSSRNLSENGHRSLGAAILGAWSLALAVGAWAFANATSAGDYTPSLRRAHYLLVLAGWLVPLAWA
ncbi:MAG: glycosyltransferase family 39 protein, partial [Anaerolineae bacterium]|nr:glycosyltransferase family 39 protein [Anaerolineae bacterium]